MRATPRFCFVRASFPVARFQMFLVVAVVVFTFSRRSGPIQMALEESRLSPLEFVETMGNLYETARAAPAAVEIVYQRLRLLLSRRLAIPPTAKLRELCNAAADRLEWPADALFHTFSQAERAMRDINPDNEEALDLVRKLHE